jgi:4-hydroxybenzoate polyprenyltransferase
MPSHPALSVARRYVSLARPDHWTKNVLMLPGIAVALSYSTPGIDAAVARDIVLTVLATCMVASGNYVLNEVLDAATDRYHPRKARRAAASGEVSTSLAMAEWIALGALGAVIAALVNVAVGVTAVVLWVMGVLYNAPPIRLKDLPYLDVLCESANNALRLGLGWFAVVPDRYPPFSLVLAYWMGGAFLMAVKRFSEYRELQARGVAGAYRRSFDRYTERTLLVSSVFYATLGAQFGGMFILRYRLELVLVTPVVAALFACYLHLAFSPGSAAQHPERLYRERMLSGCLLACVLLFTALMFVHLPWLYDWFTVEPAGIVPLWRVGAAR